MSGKDRPRSSRGARPARPAAKTAWDEPAEWYDQLVGEEGSEYQREVVFPGTLRLLAVLAGEAVLDVGCGQGALCRLLAERGARPTGVDASQSLIDLARKRGGEIAYLVGDAGRLGFLKASSFAAAACVLAIQNIDPIQPVFAGVARALAPWGRFVLVMMHPCFRSPKHTGWGWEGDGLQYRRVERYLLPRKHPIITHPGKDSSRYTWTFHRPLQAYVRALAAAGFVVDAMEEWASHKTSGPGPRKSAEDAARREIPMFLAIRGLKRPVNA